MRSRRTMIVPMQPSYPIVQCPSLFVPAPHYMITIPTFGAFSFEIERDDDEPVWIFCSCTPFHRDIILINVLPFFIAASFRL
jgi:hypothetical protein